MIRFAVACSALFIAACGGGSSPTNENGPATATEPTATFAVAGALQTPNADGSFDNITREVASAVVIENGVGFAYAFGDTDNPGSFGFANGNPNGAGFVAVAGLLPNTSVGAVRTFGNATLSGEYDLVLVTGTEQSANPQDWEAENFVGPVTLSANFDTGEVTTTSGNLDVAGLIDGRSLVGSVTFRGNDAILGGRIGGTAGNGTAVAAFAGQGRNTLMAGGFIATE